MGRKQSFYDGMLVWQEQPSRVEVIHNDQGNKIMTPSFVAFTDAQSQRLIGDFDHKNQAAINPKKRWLKTRFLGSGSYGTVSLAISSDYPKPIAIKSSRLSMSHSLQKEDQILNSFIFVPEILQSHGSEITYEDGFLVYNLILEFAPYGTLADLVQKQPFLETKATKVYIRMLLRGLSCIHKKGFVHCDLKPENILVFPPSPFHDDSAFYHLKIGDFGLSRTPEESINEDDWKFKFRGTPFYMSPESIACGQIEAPLDIWSLGCIVIEMITGYPVWWNQLCTKGDILIKVGLMKEAPRIPCGLSDLCIDFLSKCFVKNPSERWTADMLLSHRYLLY